MNIGVKSVSRNCAYVLALFRRLKCNLILVKSEIFKLKRKKLMETVFTKTHNQYGFVFKKNDTVAENLYILYISKPMKV